MWRAFEALEHRLERAAGQLGIDAAQGVVRAELEDHRLGSVGDGPVEPREPAGGGVAGYPGIGDLCRRCPLPQRPLRASPETPHRREGHSRR